MLDVDWRGCSRSSSSPRAVVRVRWFVELHIALLYTALDQPPGKNLCTKTVQRCVVVGVCN